MNKQNQPNKTTSNNKTQIVSEFYFAGLFSA